jgi:lipopolysaccharide/colanic/teichoic acid biosynthesis glycosyltransferase
MTKTHPETNNFQEILNNISMNLVFDKLAVFFNDKKKKFQIETELLNEKYFLRKFLDNINKSLENEDYFIGRIETLEDWRERKRGMRIFFLGYWIRMYYFILFRVFPRLKLTNYLYTKIFKRNKRLLSKSEIIGRFMCSGFKVEFLDKIDQYHFVVARKVKLPITQKVSYGPFFKMPRVGKNGKLFYVYKLRTMHPFAEFMQEYMIEEHGYSHTGKLKDDFRMTRWAKVFRKYWIDEIPQLINLLKGDMAIVGVRPVSKIYFDLLPEELRNERLKYKPGCIPPYVSLNFKSSKEDVLAAEEIYLNQKKIKPLSTDFVYFFKAIYNIVIKRKRSN